tara:strand:+ start:1224 stop:1370 length:147 start_codon:yes stop_codon:yes gene_type:complete
MLLKCVEIIEVTLPFFEGFGPSFIILYIVVTGVELTLVRCIVHFIDGI